MGKWRSPKLWITLASLTLIGVALVQQSAQLRQQSLDSQGWWWLLLGLGLTWLSILINGLAWRVVLGWLGSVPEDLAVVPLFVRSNLLKYLPGGIWHLVERVRLLRPSMGGGPALAGVILDPLLIVAASCLMLMAGGWQNGLVLLAPIPALMLLPRWREPILQRLERSKAAQLQMAGDQPLEIEGSGRSGYPWSPLVAELTFVVCRFSGFFCCVQAFNLAQPAPSQWLAAFGLAYAIGLVVPGAPGGLGVFEATLLVRLGGGVSEAPLLAVVLSYRLISTLADVLAVGSFRADRSIAGWLARRN
ncbi:MAG: lysylphosphatidylglycerol synthase domain-containing protein [Synechococcus sp. cluster2_bin.44]|nr:lysylphosphatidylglycerol synthase domain-containing protein [Synechococcus sp. cluster2_bin.44]